MKYLSLLLVIFLLNFAKLGYAQESLPSPSQYLYIPTVFSSAVYKTNPPTSITFETMFYVSLVNTLGNKIDGKTCAQCSSFNITSPYSTLPCVCEKTNNLFKKIISDKKTSDWGYMPESSGPNMLYPKLILLSDLDYNVTLPTVNSSVWNSLPSNTWSIMPDNIPSGTLSDAASPPCGYGSSNYFNISNAGSNGRPSNRAQELSYFCYPTKGDTTIGGRNAMQSYINKSFESPNKIGRVMRPMFVFSSVTTYLSPVNAPSSSTAKTSCALANSYDTTDIFWGFPFRGQQCEDTQLKNVYFMIIEEVD